MISTKENKARLLFAICVAALISISTGSVPTEAAKVTGGGGEQTAENAAADLDNQIVVYYFHGARRCKTCLTIEAYAEEG